MPTQSPAVQGSTRFHAPSTSAGGEALADSTAGAKQSPTRIIVLTVASRMGLAVRERKGLDAALRLVSLTRRDQLLTNPSPWWTRAILAGRANQKQPAAKADPPSTSSGRSSACDRLVRRHGVQDVVAFVLRGETLPSGARWPGVCLQPARHAQRFSEVAVEQVHVAAERERRRVVPEPVVDLDRVAALAEQQRRARVPERVEPGPRHTRLLAPARRDALTGRLARTPCRSL